MALSDVCAAVPEFADAGLLVSAVLWGSCLVLPAAGSVFGTAVAPGASVILGLVG